MPGDRAPLQLVANRRVVHISGFEPVGIDVLERRMASGLRKFGALWGAAVEAAGPAVSDDRRAVTWAVDAAGPNWTTRCRYTVLRWDELMRPYTERSWLGRMAHGYAALFGLVLDGTLRRYFKANVRYGLFFIYPLLLLAGFLVLAAGAGIAAALLGIPGAAVTAPLVAVAVFLVLLRFLGAYFYLDFALADWAFAVDLARGRVAGLDPIVARFTDEVAAALADAEADEVLLSSVSLGAVMLAEAIDRVLSDAEAPAVDFRRVAFLTVGSSILKIGLHPAAGRLRQLIGRLGSAKRLYWVEYQAKVDPINFYKTDPVADLGNPKTGRPMVRQVRLRDMMTAADYRKAQRSALLLHRQFVLPNGKRYFYDFYQIAFGPLPLRRRVRLGDKAARLFSRDGSVRPEPARKGRKTMAEAR